MERLADENRAFYETADGRGVLRAMELPFEHRWIYLFELIQNAVDARARSIAVSVADDSLTFEHDGDNPIDESDVRGISKVFRSTKGASSVGFMGIGFKSVFGRFREARIAGSGWRFRYAVPHRRGAEYGDVQPDLLGAVIPIWDDDIAAPTNGFTTRFELRGVVHPQHNLRSDLTAFLPEDDRTPLAILADAGLRRMTVDGRVWDLGLHEGSDDNREAVALSEDENLLWQLFPVSFQPSKEAIARFLEHRRIQPSEVERDQVYAEACRPRRVLGILPLGDNGVPAPPPRGRVYATLPTDVDLPFGLHINADWLLNISRTGLKEIEDNPWQRDIVQRVADVLGRLLRWAARTQSKPDAVRAAFGALDAPSQSGSRLESLFADEEWLNRLRCQLHDAAVVPTLTERHGPLTFVKPTEAVHLPSALAKALEGDMDLAPTVLLGGPVLARGVLGRGGRDLLERAGLLTKLAPEDLARRWAGGLEEWWETLDGDESRRRDALFHVWGAIAELMPSTAPKWRALAQGELVEGSADRDWRSVRLRCVRTATGDWRSVDEVAFFKEAPPSDREPGGVETRELIEDHIPDVAACLSFGWMSALRQVSGPPSGALKWIEREAASIDLRDAVAEAMDALSELPGQDWTVLVPLGHWAMHRNRPDLLTWVLVDSSTGPRGVPIGDALVADPYVERGDVRRRLLPRVPPIAAAYGEQDPGSESAQEWRLLFEKAGAQGTLSVRPINRWRGQRDREAVSEFLGLDPGHANKNGYRLRDFEIEPQIPDSDAEEDVRQALAPWLEDGFSSMANHGRRIATSSYFGDQRVVGSRSSSWLRRLADLDWVSCDDSRLRAPKDVLPRPDPARSDAPVAQLSEELVRVLEQEGLKFGSAIPEAPALRRLMALGDRLGADELSDLLREVREDGSNEDRSRLAQVVRDLSVLSESGQRFSLDRIVRRAGAGGSLRGALGGWILSLDGIAEPLREELAHDDFPFEFPDTTTGEQALAYLERVWERAGTSGEGLANQVREVLPAAYAYCLDDCAGDESLAERWRQAVPGSAVFAEREWMRLADSSASVYFDDLEDRRFAPRDSSIRTATGGHLGNFPGHQMRTAQALGLPLLSDLVDLRWEEGAEREVADWTPRFELVGELLAHARERGRADGVGGTEGEPGLPFRLVERLELWVKVGASAPEPVPVNARLNKGVLIVAGRPVEFASDAAAELVRELGLRQRADLAVAISGMFGAIADGQDFALAAKKFTRAFAQGFDLPAALGTSPNAADAPNDEARSAGTDNVSLDREPDDAPLVGPEDPPGLERVGGSFDRDRALAPQRAAVKKLRQALKGELEQGDDEAQADQVDTSDDGTGSELGDEDYRRIAAEYERLSGRQPELGDPHQAGWDLQSQDPLTGVKRLIEVKGRGRPWTEDEVVELSRAQVSKAFEARSGKSACVWYLYVVERSSPGAYQVLPIENPADTATKWILRGDEWRMIADEPKLITRASAASDTTGE